MISLSICMIVKNEEKILERCLSCIHTLAEELIIVDTGSTDRTKEIARRYTKLVYDYKWNDDFSAARNFSFSKATKDYIYVADADEVLDEENQQRFLKLKQTLSPAIEIVEMKYANQLQFDCTYNFDVEYRPKLYKRIRSFHWIDPVHETVELNVAIQKSDIVIQHMPLNVHAPRDFSVFQKFILNGSALSAKLHCLYARELFIAGTDTDFFMAYPYFENTLHDEKKNMEEIRASQCVAARCCRLSKDDFNFFKAALKNVIANPCAEICCELGDYYYEKQDYEEAATWYYTAAFGADCELNVHYSGDIPLRKLSASYEKLEELTEAEKYRKSADEWQIPSSVDDN